MAQSDLVKQYLACWLQLGKTVIRPNGESIALAQSPVQGDRYSPEFEAIWQQLVQQSDSYLEGTHQTLGQLLSPAWDIAACARCEMPVPTLSLGMRSPSCPCADLPTWPNTDLPQPRPPLDTQAQLDRIRDRLVRNQIN